jgi:uncharacterized protein YlaI
METIYCLMCHCPEKVGFRPDGSQRRYEPTREFICSNCTRLLSVSTPEQINAAYEKAMSANEEAKLKILEYYMEDDDGKGSVASSNKINVPSVVRKRVGRTAELARERKRA